MQITEFRQLVCGDLAHAATAAVQHDLRILVRWELVKIPIDLVVGDKGIRSLDLALWNMDVCKEEVLARQHLT
ncbi:MULTISPECIES: hypothetical protein [unclassified Mesorhizobium]|uniref:hypothetical protein n=1 Tax=Mesorhizobium sp. M1D.F.Ca.ET.043.01.1.1 TaxID=2493669 RepID=UPI001FE16465|nr:MULTISPECIES: hypothetical protein [unclassified Mesorhizobium]